MRTIETIETIDAELRVLVTVRRSILELGGKPRTAVVDQLLDERFEIRTATGKSTVLQCALSGGPNTVSSHVRHVQVVWPPPCTAAFIGIACGRAPRPQAPRTDGDALARHVLNLVDAARLCPSRRLWVQFAIHGAPARRAGRSSW